MARKTRDIGAEILRGLREIQRGQVGRVINVPLDEDDDLIDRLLEHNPGFQNYLKTCLRSRSLSSAEALRE